MSKDNVEVVRRAYEAFNRGDRDAAVADVAADCEYGASGGDRVVVSVTTRGSGKHSGAEASWVTWQVWTLRDGKAVRGEGFSSRRAALEAAGLSE